VSLLGLLAVWALGLVTGFAGLQWSAGSHLVTASGAATFLDDLYMSGTTFFTLGLGDVHPVGRVARALTVAESGLGFGFSRSSSRTSGLVSGVSRGAKCGSPLLDAWAGSPPAAADSPGSASRPQASC